MTFPYIRDFAFPILLKLGQEESLQKFAYVSWQHLFELELNRRRKDYTKETILA